MADCRQVPLLNRLFQDSKNGMNLSIAHNSGTIDPGPPKLEALKFSSRFVLHQKIPENIISYENDYRQQMISNG
jgi:hypothetical protein